MLLLLFALLSALGCGLYIASAGFVFWKAALVFVGIYLGIHLLLLLFFWLVSLTVKPTEETKTRNRLALFCIETIAELLMEYGHAVLEVEGEELLPKEGRFLLICNHRSLFDPVSLAARRRNYELAFLSKPENMAIPIGGKLASAIGYMAIDRENDRNALKSILAAADLLKRGLCSVCVYPEGTRSKTRELLPFHPGSFKIAQRGGVPLVICGTHGTEKIRRNAPFRKTVVKLRILEVLPAEKVKAMNTQTLAEHSRNLIAAWLKEEEQ